MTDNDKRQAAFERAMFGDVLRDVYLATHDAKFAYLLGVLDGVNGITAKLEECRNDAR